MEKRWETVYVFHHNNKKIIIKTNIGSKEAREREEEEEAGRKGEREGETMFHKGKTHISF